MKLEIVVGPIRFKCKVIVTKIDIFKVNVLQRYFLTDKYTLKTTYLKKLGGGRGLNHL
jgi:hypothetical protein